MIALSTAYKEAIIAIDINGKQGFKTLDANCKHSENLLPALDETLSQMNCALAENDKFAVVIGPGSFTGLRISVALVKGLLAGDDQKRILPLTTFDLMAYSYIKNFSPKEEFVCVINALSGKYFVCKYNSSGEKLEAEKMISQIEFQQISCAKISLQEENVCDVLVKPQPQDLLEIVNEKLKTENLISAQELTPLYIRRSQAEDDLKEKEKKSKI